MTRDLVPVHGGLDEPVDRVVPLSKRKELVAEAAALPSMRVSRADLSTLHRIADGALSPLEGPMGAEAWTPRARRARASSPRGKRYAWTIPLALPVTDDEAARALARRLGRGARRGRRPGRRSSTTSSVFDWDKDALRARVYGTTRASTTRAAAGGAGSAHAAARRQRCASLPQPMHPSTAST